MRGSMGGGEGSASGLFPLNTFWGGGNEDWSPHPRVAQKRPNRWTWGTTTRPPPMERGQPAQREVHTRGGKL